MRDGQSHEWSLCRQRRRHGARHCKAEQTRIFEQFHQVDSSNTKAKRGTGIRLAIAKQIVEMHDGRIWVESTLGKGATIQVELPTRVDIRRDSQ